MRGTLYGVGVGPGDPELMTYKAVRVIEECQVIAVPAKGKQYAVSYKIASGKVKNIEKKKCLDLETPMTKNRRILEENYEKAAEKIIEELEKGDDVAYLTLGDPTIYSTYMYVHRIIKSKGYKTKIINGIPSFCAASASLDESLADRAEELHVIPSNYGIEEALEYSGTRILMKPASRLSDVKRCVEEKGEKIDVKMVENCGMPEEQIYKTIEEIPDQAGYYSLLIVKESKRNDEKDMQENMYGKF